jgi:diguanylate cyclase (GGDEF)-like protein/PAS domain S-box-containing protein
MTLHKKTVLIISATLGSLIIVLSVASRIILTDSFSKLEEKYARLNMERIVETLSDDIANINRSANDWAAWDETHAFIRDANAHFIKVNIVDSAFSTLRLNVMIFVNASGRVIFGRAFDLEGKKRMPVPQSLIDHLKSDDLLLKSTHAENSISGIILLSEMPMLISSQPILTSDGKGSVRGALIFGRYLNEAQIQRLRELTHLAVHVHPYNDLKKNSDWQGVQSSLSEEKNIFIRPFDTQTIEGYTMLKDIYGKPAVLFRVAMNRDIYVEGQNILYYSVLSFLLVGLVLSMVALILLEEQVLSRITALIRSVGVIGTSGDLSKRVQMKGKDEIAFLSEEMNKMLETIEKSDRGLRNSEEKYRLIVEHANEAIVIVQNGKLMYANPKTVQITGYSEEELSAKAFLEFVHPGDRSMVTERYYKRIMDQEVPAVYAFRIIDKSGSTKWVEINAVKTAWEGKEATLNFISDITERKELEEELRNMSQRDPLTGLYNRRGFITLAEQQMKIADRMNRGMLLIFVDLDDLKQINDTYGHYQGDRALTDVALLLQKTFREADILARYGGDEFVVLMIETPESGDELFLTRLGEHLEYYNRSEQRPFRLSLSTGFSRYTPGTPVNFNDLLIEADRIMYEQKKAKK